MSEISFDLATAMQTVTRERSKCVVMSFLLLNKDVFYLLFIVILVIESNHIV